MPYCAFSVKKTLMKHLTIQQLESASCETLQLRWALARTWWNNVFTKIWESQIVSEQPLQTVKADLTLCLETQGLEQEPQECRFPQVKLKQLN